MLVCSKENGQTVGCRLVSRFVSLSCEKGTSQGAGEAYANAVVDGSFSTLDSRLEGIAGGDRVRDWYVSFGVSRDWWRDLQRDIATSFDVRWQCRLER